MSSLPAAFDQLAAIPDAELLRDASMSEYTRFGLGGPAAILFDTCEEGAFLQALTVVTDAQAPHIVIGGGTNLVVSDQGFDGIVLRYRGRRICAEGTLVRAEAGAVLQDVVDRTIALGLRGLETMTGIPGYLGGAVYGNAGAYGHSIQEFVRHVRAFDGSEIRGMTNEECGFGYRTSAFKNRKSSVILSADLEFTEDDRSRLQAIAAEIRTLRDAKYPPDMRCAGSIFKNVFVRDLPASVREQIPPKVVREGKAPSAWFLEQTGAKGMRRGEIQVADYHANLIYNDGAGTAADLVAVIEQLKAGVRDRFGFDLEEEVQFVGFDERKGRKQV